VLWEARCIATNAASFEALLAMASTIDKTKRAGTLSALAANTIITICTSLRMTQTMYCVHIDTLYFVVHVWTQYSRDQHVHAYMEHICVHGAHDCETTHIEYNTTLLWFIRCMRFPRVSSDYAYVDRTRHKNRTTLMSIRRVEQIGLRLCRWTCTERDKKIHENIDRLHAARRTDDILNCMSVCRNCRVRYGNTIASSIRAVTPKIHES
jgi:hypothetical protein